jgi:hypothetical protein
VVRSQPGLLSLETLSDVNDHHKYVVMSEVSCSVWVLLPGSEVAASWKRR